MSFGSMLRSALVGFGLGVVACLAAVLLPARTALPPPLCAAAVLLVPILAEGLLRRAGVSLGSFSPWGLLLGEGGGIAALIGVILLDWPLSIVGAAAATIGALAFFRPVGHTASRGRPLHYATIGAVSTLLTIGATARWLNAMPLTSMPVFGPLIVAATLLVLTCAGAAASSLLRHRLRKRTIEMVMPFLIGAGIVVLAALVRPVPRVAANAFATQVELPSLSFLTYLLGIALIAVRLLFLPAIAAGFCLGFIYGIRRRRGRSFLLATTPSLLSLLVLATPVLPLVARLAQPEVESAPWVGLCSPESAVFHPADLPDSELVAFASTLIEPARGPLLIVGDGADALRERFAAAGHGWCLAAEHAADAAAELARHEQGGSLRAGALLLLPSVLGAPDPGLPPGWPLFQGLRTLTATGAAMVQILSLGTTSLDCLRAVVATIGAAFGPPALWVSGIHGLVVCAPSEAQRRLEPLEQRATGPWRILASSEVARIGEAETQLPIAFLAPQWQRRLQPYDPLLAARHLRWLLGISSWPSSAVTDANHFRARVVESLIAARLTLDRPREIELAQAGLAALPGDAAIASFCNNADAHYGELKERVLNGLRALPGDTTLNFELARLHAADGSYQAAQELLTGTVIRLRRNLVEAYSVLADVLEHMDRARGLPGVIEKNGLPYCGEALDVVETAVRGYAGAGDAGKARSWLEVLRRRDPTRPGLALLAAEVALAEQRIDDARGWLERARTEDPLSQRIGAALRRLDPQAAARPHN
ncbi:MAG: hypothetical protein U1E76_08525 [Planctomycetota bacterium]